MITTNIKKVIDSLSKNNVVGIPTETVYGLAGNAYSESAVKKIFALKNRPLKNPLIVHIHSLEQLKEIADDIPPIAFNLANAFWPGPLTLILKRKNSIPDLVTAGQDTVAVRIPKHPITLELLNSLNFPLAAPSANPFGRISPISAQHVEDYFGEKIPFVLDGGICTRGIESTIIGFDQDKTILYRHGAIAIESIQKCTGKIITQITHQEEGPVAPGMMSRHYSPRTKLVVSTNPEVDLLDFPEKKIGLLRFKDEVKTEKVAMQILLSKTGNLSEAASNLYDALHQLDNSGLDLIIAEQFPSSGLGLTINDRLLRASKV